MTETFDPYYKWLGIMPGEQKNYYRLLGLNLFESDRDVIENLADQKIVAIRNYQIKYPQEATIILNQLTKAKVTLLDPIKKKEYDQKLRKSLSNNNFIPVSEPPVMAHPPKPEEFPQPQQTSIPIGEIPVTTHPPKPEEFQKTQQINNITGKPSILTQFTNYSTSQNTNISNINAQLQLNPKNVVSDSYDDEFKDIISDIHNALQHKTESANYENLDQNDFSGSCIGYLKTIENNKNLLDKLKDRYKNLSSTIQKQYSKYQQKQNDDIKKVNDKYWNSYVIGLGCFVCILIPPLIIVLGIYSMIIQNKVKKKIAHIENVFRPRFSILHQQQKKLDGKYHELLKTLLNFNFTEQQNFFLNEVKNVFFKNKVVGMKPASEYDVKIYNQYSKTNNEYCSIVDNVSFKNLDPGFLDHTIPTIKIENLKLYFFPQGLLIEEFGKFSELNYNKINITSFENGLVVEKYPQENAEIAGTFWEHTRINGEQDMRYKDNPQYFIVKYSGVLIQSNSFSAKPFYFSHKESAELFIKELTELIRTAPIIPTFS